MTYLDFATPLRAAGAVQNKRGDWFMPGTPSEAFHASQALREFDLEPLRVDPPKTRTAAALRKAYGGAPAVRTPGGIDHLNMRAAQYHAAMHGRDTEHSTCLRGLGYAVRHGTAADGSRRARFVGDWEIPNWDFVATVEETTLPDVFS